MTKPSSSEAETKTLLIAIGGPTCSGKTSLVKHIQSVLPDGDSFIIHQDDFAPPEAELPYNPSHPDWQDWDYPPTAIEWNRLARALAYSRTHGKPCPEIKSHDHLNAQDTIPLDQGVLDGWTERFRGLKQEIEHVEGKRVVFGLVDGFLLFWDQKCTSLYDVPFFLRVPRETLRKRREDRAQYVTQTGDVWTDPPEYHPLVVWPAYEFGHRHMFTQGDVEHGELVPRISEWDKDAEQRSGGWAKETLDRLVKQGKREVGEGVGPSDGSNAQDRKGKGRDTAIDQGAEWPEKIVHELRPEDGSRGMQDMVNTALSTIFDAVKTMPL